MRLFRWKWLPLQHRMNRLVPFWKERHWGTHFPIWICRNSDYFQNRLQRLNNQLRTWWHPRNENVLKLICSNHGMVVQNSSGSDVPIEHIISNVVKSLLSCLVLIHVERVIDFGCKDTLPPGLDCVYWRRKILNLGLSQEPLSTNLVVSQALAHPCQYSIFPSIEH